MKRNIFLFSIILMFVANCAAVVLAQNNTDSENSPPGIPVLTMPADATFEAREYTDADEDLLDYVGWEVSSDGIVLFRLNRGETVLELPELFLESGLPYYSRAKFVDTAGSESEWSEALAFTVTESDGDSNENGIPDCQELADPEVFFSDSDTDVSVYINAMTEDGSAGAFEVTPGKNADAVIHLKAVSADDIESDMGKPESLPFGLIAVNLMVSEGNVAEVTIRFSQAAADLSTWYVYDELAGEYSEYAYSSFIEDGTSVILEFEDGGFGDVDGAANGRIVLPLSGPGTRERCSLATFSANPRSGKRPLRVEFNSSGSVGTLVWSFGDGATDTAQNPVHTYDESGTYTVTLTATGENGCTHSSKKTIEVWPKGGSVSAECFISSIAEDDFVQRFHLFFMIICLLGAAVSMKGIYAFFQVQRSRYPFRIQR